MKGQTPRTAVGGRVTREGVKDVEMRPRLVDDYLVSQVTAGHEMAAQAGTDEREPDKERD